MRDKVVLKRVGLIVFGILILAGCNFPWQSTPESGTPGPRRDTPTAPADDSVSVTADRDDVSTISAGGQAQPLLAPDEAFLAIGDSVDVTEVGRAILQFADLLTVEVLRDGGLQLQAVDINDQSAFITVLQNGGVLVNDFDPQQEIDRRFTVQTEFATITATGTRFMVVREEGSPLEWIVGLDAPPGDLQVTADGVTKDVVGNVARWIAPIGEPSAGVDIEMGAVQNWIGNLQAGEAVPELGETLWPQADVLLDTSTVSDLPQPGEPFALGNITLTLAQGGEYALQDCNNDLISDIAVFGGAIEFDFRTVLNRVRALDVTVVNREGGGLLQAYDPARELVSEQAVSQNYGQVETLSLRAELPYHYAQLSLDNGCFLGLSLTPPDANGGPGAPRSPVLAGNAIVIDEPRDGSGAVANGFTLTGRATIAPEAAKGALWLQVETDAGEVLQRYPLEYTSWDFERGFGQFSQVVSVRTNLPANIRVRVLLLAPDNEGVLEEGSIALRPLNPSEDFSQRPQNNGFITALNVGDLGRYDVAITIDGESGDWTTLENQNTASVAFGNLVYDQDCSNRYPDSPEHRNDLLGIVNLAFDENNLYVSFTVYDDGYDGYLGEDQRYFLGDAPQLLLDLDLRGDFADQKDSRDDIELDFHPGRDEPGDGPLVALWRLDTLDSRVMEEALIGATPLYVFEDGSYFLEAAIPWESLGVAPEPGLRLGVAASISDNDTPGTDVQECMISTARNRDWQDPTTWGTLELEP
jgi:hypothetical protein